MPGPSPRFVVVAPVLLVFACGTPVDPSGKPDASFVKASMGGQPGSEGADRPLAADLAVEPVSMLVMFNRLQTPEKLQEALNKKPGQFSHIDLDNDSVPDPLTVAKKDSPDGNAFEIRVRPTSGEFVVATMVFDPEWSYLGHYNGIMGGAASTVARPLPVAPLATPLPAAVTAPSVSQVPTAVTVTPPPPGPPVAVGAAPVAGAPPPALPAPSPAGTVQAAPAGAVQQPGLQATP